ncbi:hypothetical protein BAE36_17750 [Rhizobium leguminosarum bv. trifolii]|uniref:Acyl-homoserine-lactone synthase 2 n=1 Tax=Rhizobium leguminosarum bv. trifolii TaxID=386 RepID=A0A1B8RAU4_RHILT|nr:acyl-homoserine-lactone synthase 2 [Rhizobium leguminosarum bv. trifolii]OBY05898.1 hypothetical protein BAE36_17750 [Rhizobium leguminosarum bv. trifolii]
MLRILTKDMLETDRRAFDEMFRARAAVFRDRLGWRVDVRNQWERDRYQALPEEGGSPRSKRNIYFGDAPNRLKLG